MPPKTLSNKVNPLTWNVPIVDTKTGSPTPEFQRKWQQQAAANASVTDLTTAAAVSAVIDLISSTVGALLVRGASQWTGLVPVADGRVLRDKGVGATPIWDTISDILDTLGSVQGDVLYRDTAAWKVLAPGTAGQVLTTGGAAANPSWATSASGGGAVSSVNDDGTAFYIALADADGQLILDGLGDPVFLPEVFPPAALPLGSSSAFGALKVDGTTILAAAGILSLGTAVMNGLYVTRSTDQSVTDSTITTVLFDTVSIDTQSAYVAGTGIYTPTKAGKYLIFGGLQGAAAGAVTLVETRLTKNGSTLVSLGLANNASSGAFAMAVVSMNGTTDTLLSATLIIAAGGSDRVVGGSGQSFFGAVYLGT